jgi:hypothetical protein
MRNPVKLPRVGNALENVRAKILERDAGAGHKILDRARDHNIVGASEPCDPRCDSQAQTKAKASPPARRGAAVIDCRLCDPGRTR